GASLLTLIYTHGDIGALITMYSINVFVTFSLSQLGMCRFWVSERGSRPDWRRPFFIHAIGLVLCFSILVMVVVEKFEQGAWLTLVITGALIALCVLIRRHYRTVYLKLARLTEDLGSLPSVPPTTDPNTPPPVARELDARKSLAVLLVGGYGGL